MNNKYRSFILITSGFVAALGFNIILSWLFGWTYLISFAPGFTTMKFNTSVGLMLVGLSIFLQHKPAKRPWVEIAKAMGFLVLAIGAATLFEYWTHISLGIDQLVVPDSDVVQYPGRMSQITAICLVLLGFFTTSIGSSSKKYIWLGQAGLHIVTLLSFISLVGYFFQVPQFYKLNFFSSVAIHTAGSLFFLSIAASLVNPTVGITSLFTQNKIGNLMARKMILQMSIVALLLGYIRIWSHRHNLVSVEFGIALFATSFVLLLLFVVWRLSAQLNEIDAQKNEAQNNLDRLKIFLDSTPDPILLLDSTGIIRLANKRTEHVFGYRAAELIGNDVKMLVPERLYPQMTQYRYRFLEGQGELPTGWDIELTARRKDGTEFPAEISLSRIESIEGFFLSVDIRDVTVRHAEQVQLNSMATIIDTSSEAIISKNLQGTILTWNKGAENILGYTAGEAIGKSIKVLFPEESHSEGDALMQQVLQGKNVEQYETKRLRKDGVVIPVAITLSPIRDNGGQIIAVSKILRDISRRKKAEADLKLLSERLMFATSFSQVGIWDYNVVTQELIWNDIMFPLYGVDKSETEAIPYLVWRKAVHPGDLERVLALETRALNGEIEFDTDFRVVWPNGVVRHLKARAAVLRNEQGQAVRMLGTNWDITAQKDATLALQQSNERNRIFVEQAPNALAMFDTQMRYMAASRKWKEDYRLTGVDIIGRSHYEIFPEIGEDWKAIHRECLQGAINQADEAPFTRADGSTQWITWDVRPWYVAEGQIGGLLMYTADITHIKERDAERRRIQHILEHTNKIAKIATWELNAVTNEAQWSDIAYEVFELPWGNIPDRETLLNLYVPGANRDKLEAAIALQIEKGVPYDLELEIITPKGNHKWIRLIGEAEFENGICKRRFGVFQDITKAKQVEREINLANEELKAIFNSGYVSIISTNVDGLITNFSKGAEALLQYTADEMVNTNTPAIIHEPEEVIKRGKELSAIYQKEVVGFDVFVEVARQGRHESREWTYVRKDGTKFPVQLIVSARRNSAGEVTGFIGVATDITERKTTEAKLRNYSILEAKSKEMEQFAYVTSHDLREPLLTIKNYVHLLLEDYKAELATGDGPFITSSITRAVARMEALIKGLLDYSRLSQIKQLQPVNGNQLMQDVLADLNALITGSDATVTVGPMPTLNAYPLELKLLLQNLVNNAVKFRKPDMAPVVEVSAHAIPGGWQFEVKDNGIGIDDIYREKIFVIFQRLHSRDEYEGTGIGLAQGKKIAELHNGRIWVESEKAKGSKFCFTILT
jgi:PAS domain S-box-containing protein